MLNNLKILCVEDDLFALEEMVLFLKKRAGKVFSAQDGEEGIKQFEIHKPDIVVADLLMPGIDGMEMLRGIKAMEPKVHAIIVSSVNDLDTVLETMDMGVDNYIVKPLEFDALELKLNKIADAISWERGGFKGVLDGLENKHEIEDQIKKEFIKCLKNYMGKGPREITIYLTEDKVKITVLGTLTVMEENLMKDMKNHQVVKHARQLAYEAITKEFVSPLNAFVNRKMGLEKIEIDLKKKLDQIVFKVLR